MSAKGNCYDNACAESFFYTMKVKAIHGERFATREEITVIPAAIWNWHGKIGVE